MRSALFLLAAAITMTMAGAQQPASTPQTVVNPNGSITFRYSNAGAASVFVDTDAVMKPLAMQKDAAGTWTATTPPLKPEHYGYSFVVNGGTPMLDPLNHTLRPNLLGFSSDILVPGSVPEPWELTAIPHGELTHHLIPTHIARNLPQNLEPYVVYTPPGYDRNRAQPYPVLYLLHGFSDTEVGWTAVGQAQYILDTLLSEGKIVPMVVVMPMGYGDYHFVTNGSTSWQNQQAVDDNTHLYMQMLTSEVMPAVEAEYHVATDRDHRAIAGLSMGGLESLTAGILHNELFSYVIGMSAALHDDGNFNAQFPALAAGVANSGLQFHLLWVGCGTEDHLLQPNLAFTAWARGKGIPVTLSTIPGQHTWLVWRQNLISFAPLLFR